MMLPLMHNIPVEFYPGWEAAPKNLGICGKYGPHGYRCTRMDHLDKIHAHHIFIGQPNETILVGWTFIERKGTP